MNTNDLLDQALADYRSANARCAYYSLRHLAEVIRAASPEATTLVLDWSDQGDHLSLVDVIGYAENEDPEDEDCVAANLDPSNEYVWAPLVRDPDEPRSRRNPGDYRFDIDAVLAATASEYDPNPT